MIDSKHSPSSWAVFIWLLGIPASVLLPLAIGLDLLIDFSDWLGIFFLVGSVFFFYLALKAVPPFTIEVNSLGICDRFMGIVLRCLKWGEIEKIVKVRTFNGFTTANNYFVCGKGANAFSVKSLKRRIAFDEHVSGFLSLKERLVTEAMSRHISILVRDRSRGRSANREFLPGSLDD